MTAVHRFKDTNGRWRALNTILPPPPDLTDPRGVTITFHGRYRGPHNTGVPDRTALKTPVLGRKFATPNLTFNDEHFIGECDVTATGIVFNRCYFESRGDTYCINATAACTLNDCDLYGGRYFSNHAVVFGATHLVRCHLWGSSADVFNPTAGGLCEDSYLHGADVHFGNHADVLQTIGGNNMGMIRSKLIGYHPYSTPYVNNSVMELGTTGPASDNLQIIDNYIDGGGAAINGSLTAVAITNAVLTGNRWGRKFTAFPVAAAIRISPPNGIFDATNVYDDTGVAV